MCRHSHLYLLILKLFKAMKEEDIPFAERLPEHENLYFFDETNNQKITIDRVSPAVEGYFRFPAVWIGEAPHAQQVEFLNPEIHNAVIVEQKLSCGIIAYAYRNGMFLFDFLDWKRGSAVRIPGYTAPEGRYKVSYSHTQAENKAEEIAMLRAKIMNVHQACLSAAENAIKRRSAMMGFPVSAWSTYKAAIPNLPIHYSDDSEDALTFVQNAMDNKDRVRRARPYNRRVLEIDVVQYSFELLDKILQHSNSSALYLVESLFLSACRYRDKCYGESVTLGWLVCEQLISIAWKEYLSKIGSISSDQDRMPKERREKLVGRDYTASMMVEALEMVNIINSKLYRELEIARKSRNKWAHDLRIPHQNEAMICMRAAEALLALILNVKLILPHAGRGGVPQWPINMIPEPIRKKIK
jgi:hypothetical protein